MLKTRDDVRNLIYTILGLFVAVLVLWISFLFIVGCGLSLDCEKGTRAQVLTPIPTLIPAGMPVVSAAESSPKVSCQIAAVYLIGAWVEAGFPESESFDFTDANNQSCVGSFAADVQPLFLEGNLWYTGSPACTTCHNPTLNEATAGMDLSTYEGILLGSRRTGEGTGNDILGNGVWEESLLYSQLFVKQAMPQGRPPEVPAEGPVIFAGSVESVE